MFEPDATTEAEPIRLEQFVARTPARVWAALTEPAALARWWRWAAGDASPVPGHRFMLDMVPWGRRPREVIAVEPERRFAIAFAQGTLDTTIAWRLEPAAGGTRVFLEHAGFDADAPRARIDIEYEGMKRGRPSVLARIEPAIDG
ncbi:SRPBCC family protein [Burkholderia thailandensis]|uniref:SRPBCC family protein n=1 Tax=Burkholderia thailandensis TaxID=57975 RepID=UPI000DC7E792|nr:SRPBCC domain-containing protein [Burkholderia thailandensis]AWY61994.1 polyketide cyclase [Burkholderia thailandensis]